jgi:hypothetical protein
MTYIKLEADIDLTPNQLAEIFVNWDKIDRGLDEIKHGDAVEITDTGGPYYTCPKCGCGNITRAFQMCIDCSIKLIWIKNDK